MRSVVAGIKLAAFLLLSMIIILTLGLYMHIGSDRSSYRFARLFHIATCRIFNLRVRIKGRPCADRHTVFVGNHISYMDIQAFGSIVLGSFVAKKEVADWPLFGRLGSLQRTVYIDRSREAVKQSEQQIRAMLEKGRSLILFPEGTSSIGKEILPFKSSFFDVFLNDDFKKKITIQPFTISLLSVNGVPASSDDVRNGYAWYGDMAFPPHLWAFAKGKGAELLISFHPPRELDGYDDRKKLTQDCQADVESGLIQNPETGLDLSVKAA